MRPFIGHFVESTKEKVFPFHFDINKDVLVTTHLEPVVKSDLRVAELMTKTEVKREEDDDFPSYLTKTKIDREDDDDDYF